VSDVLHLQTRVYPLHYGSLDRPSDQVPVPGHRPFRLWDGELASVVYNREHTVEGDLTELVRATVALPGVEIRACRARFLASGVVLLTYALSHPATTLSKLDHHALAEFDVVINEQLRQADAAVIAAALDAAVTAEVIGELAIRPGSREELWPSRVDRNMVRYNCHFVTRRPPWQPDQRVPALVLGAGCRILLPYTYAWDVDPDTPLEELLAMLEPADIAVAQVSILAGAMAAGRRTLADLARGAVGPVRTEDFRRYLDRLWAEYHSLDAYRLESGQASRATYIAARETVGLDRIHERTSALLDYVASSLLSEASARSQRLDARLNRAAAALTVVVAAAFAVDIAAFLVPDAPGATKVVIVIGVLLLAVGSLLGSIGTVWRRDRRARRIAPAPGDHGAKPVVSQTGPLATGAQPDQSQESDQLQEPDQLQGGAEEPRPTPAG
jgi:hypothetical protein